MKVRIVEVGPRDGLQNENVNLTLDQKRQFIDLLIKAGHTDIEAGAFVNPQKVPQMANSIELLKSFHQHAIRFWALVPNGRGFEDAKNSGVKSIAIFTAASDTFNKHNINATIEESLERFNEFVPEAKKLKFKIRGYISTSFGCPYEGKIKPEAVLKVTEKLLKLGVTEISIGDTIGVATPLEVKNLVKKLLKLTSVKKLALHFHDTRGVALANVLMGLQEGVRIFDSSSGGLGGCPYAPGASGNVATEDLLYMFHGMGIDTGVDLTKQVAASRYIESLLGRRLPSKYLQSLS